MEMSAGGYISITVRDATTVGAMLNTSLTCQNCYHGGYLFSSSESLSGTE